MVFAFAERPAPGLQTFRLSSPDCRAGTYIPSFLTSGALTNWQKLSLLKGLGDLGADMPDEGAPLQLDAEGDEIAERFKSMLVHWVLDFRGCMSRDQHIKFDLDMVC
jgi:hypothetical protein